MRRRFCAVRGEDPMRWLAAYVASLVVLCAGDFLWLGALAKEFYQREIGALMLARPNFAVAALFYAMYAAATLYFAIVPALADGGWTRAALNGALLGLCAYATYDLTNLATLKGWSMSIVIVDIAWGTALTAIIAATGTLAARAVA
jgi:uncharacterized membrane protein